MIANPAYHRVKRPHRSHGPLVLVSAVLLLALITALACGWLMVQTVAAYYDTRIYPNVYVLGVDLGRQTPEEATAVLERALRDLDTGPLVLRDGESHWSASRSDAGMYLDIPATVRAAFAVGHADADQSLKNQARVWLRRHDVAPVFSVDVERAREMLAFLAPRVAVPPIDAALRLEGDQVVAVPGAPGRELDVETTLSRLLAVAGGQSNPVDLVFRSVPPHISDVSGLKTQAEEMLTRRVELSAYDVLTEETFSWTLDRDDIITWLNVESTSEGPAVELKPEAIQASLADLSAGMGEGRGLRLEGATEQVMSAFNAGGGPVALYLTHASRTYTVQPGDTLSGIAAAVGMPTWMILQANPDVDPDWLSVGQALTIPSQDLLTPNLPVPGKRVVVSLAEQRMRVYENGAMIHDWVISTGIADSPTSPGVFQILNKEENAYASLWDLWMPHFVAIYPAGPDFYNGFHGLPTLSNGRVLWEGLLGTPVSYGCIILGLEEAERFYDWAEVGAVVVVR